MSVRQFIYLYSASLTVHITFGLFFVCFAEFGGVAGWLCACVEEREGVCWVCAKILI